jgi:group I intron endonuclease
MIVYLVTNTINGKRYVGATKQGLQVRRRKHLWDARNKAYCRVFHAAVRKYGDEAFLWEVLVECSSVEEMIAEEIRLIEEISPEYNIAAGGRGIIGVVRTQQWLDRMSVALKRAAANRTDAHKMSTALALEVAHQRRKKPVICRTDGRWFDSSAEAIKFYGITSSNIRSVLRGDQHQTKGLSFEFAAAVI